MRNPFLALIYSYHYGNYLKSKIAFPNLHIKSPVFSLIQEVLNYVKCLFSGVFQDRQFILEQICHHRHGNTFKSKMAASMNKIGRHIQFWLWKTKIMHKCRVFQRIVCFYIQISGKNNFILKICFKSEFTCDFCPLDKDWMSYPVWKPYWILERCHGDGAKYCQKCIIWPKLPKKSGIQHYFALPGSYYIQTNWYAN